MGRASTKENKNRYQLAREELGLSREKASEVLEVIPPERIEKIENERTYIGGFIATKNASSQTGGYDLKKAA